MRTHPDESEVIELIDADPVAFDRTNARSQPSRQVHSRQPHSRRPHSWLHLALAAALATAAFAIIVRPWETPPAWRTFPVQLAAPTMEAHLALIESPSPVISTTRGADAADPALLARSVGHLFAAPDATYEYGRWAMFHVEKGSDTVDTGATSGLPASSDAAPIERTRGSWHHLVWTPRAGERWTVTANELSESEMRTFAAAVGVHDGHASLRGGYSPPGLESIAGALGMGIARELLSSLERGSSAPQATVVRYLSVNTPTSVSTIRAPDDATRALQFVLGGQPVTVGGAEGTVATSPTLGSVLAWTVGGRLVVVTGVQSPAGTRLAAPVRAADQRDTAAATTDEGSTFVVGQGVTADDRVWLATARFGRITTICVETDNAIDQQLCASDAYAILPTTTQVSTPLGTVVVVLSNAPDPRFVQIDFRDGRNQLLPLRPLAWNITATSFLSSPGQSFSIVDLETAPADDRLRPLDEPAVRTHVIDDPRVTPYSADLTTPVTRSASFQLYGKAGGQWFWIQTARANAPAPVTLDAHRRTLDGVELVSSTATPQITTATAMLPAGWSVTVSGSGLDDARIVALIKDHQVIGEKLVASGDAAASTGLPIMLGTDWGHHALFGRVHSESTYLTADGELITLRVADGDPTAQASVYPYLVREWSRDVISTGTLQDTDEQIATWVDGDQLLSLTGHVDARTLRSLVGSVRPSIGTEWRDLLIGLRPDYRLGTFATIAGDETWRAGMQLATRRGSNQYLWWWSVPDEPQRTASVPLRDQLHERVIIDTVVTLGVTYLFVAVPDAVGDVAAEARLATGTVALSLVRPFDEAPFRVAVLRVDDPGPIEVLVDDRPVEP